jgi:uncharacterized repeat protein (TIGR01451 family)
MRRRLAVLPALVSALILLTSPVAALGTLDQQAGPFGTGRGYGVVVPRPIAQTFTAGLSGLLDTVALMPLDSMAGFEVQIQSVSGGVPTGTVLATGTTASTTVNDWVQIAFGSPATVVAGTQYAIVIVVTTQPNLWDAALTDSYAGGSHLFTDFPTGTIWTNDTNADMAFQTYVTATPILSQSKVAPPTVVAGTNLTYTLEVENDGTDAADATVTDTLPAGTTFVSLTSPAGWTTTTPAVGGTGMVTATRPSLTFADGPQTFTLVVHVDAALAAGTVITNQMAFDTETAPGGVTGVTTQVAAAAASPAASLVDAASAPPGPTSPLVTMGFGLLLAGGLGMLLVANVRRQTR